MKSFDSFDPLAAKQATQTEVAALALKREIGNILSSYVGWYDPFCELIQNSLDAVEEQASISDKNYTPTLSIIIDIQNNSLIVSDNGTGLPQIKFEQFLAPCFSFKSGNTRGHKGVGATYLAYGFNYIQVATRTEDFTTTGKMLDARKWLHNPSPPGNPQIIYDPSGSSDPRFADFTSGVSIALKFDSDTHPKSLRWLNAETADTWKKILLIKTGLGAFIKNSDIRVFLKVISSKGGVSEINFSGIEYYWPHQIVTKSKKYDVLRDNVDTLFTKYGSDFTIPSKIKNIECIHDTLDQSRLLSLLAFDEIETELIKKFDPEIYFAYMYSTKVLNKFNEDLCIRGGQSILAPGIQICANKMPQGEIIQIPLKRNIGRQNQILVIAHYHNCTPDMGRKGFQNEVVELSKSISKQIIDEISLKYKRYLKVSAGVAPDLRRESLVADWKTEFEAHEKANPIVLTNNHFFKPTHSISITSEPTREQDVIALFNQLIAGGVIRGIKIMSTNERFVYDGMYKVVFTPPKENHEYDPETNPLGVSTDVVNDYEDFSSEPKILEYKFSLDGLIENLNDGSKNSNDISLVVVWETGTDYEGNFTISSLLNEDNLSDRQYHGVTHLMTNTTTGQKEMDLIVLKELILFLNSPKEELKRQQQKYG